MLFCFAVARRPLVSTLSVLFNTEPPKLACDPFHGHATEFGREVCGEVLPPGEGGWPVHRRPAGLCRNDQPVSPKHVHLHPPPAAPRLQTQSLHYARGFLREGVVLFLSPVFGIHGS